MRLKCSGGDSRRRALKIICAAVHASMGNVQERRYKPHIRKKKINFAPKQSAVARARPATVNPGHAGGLTCVSVRAG